MVGNIDGRRADRRWLADNVGLAPSADRPVAGTAGPTARGVTYAIGDVHGCLDLLSQALDRIRRHADDHGLPHRIVLLGDYVDRGPDSRGVIEFLMRAGPTVTCLLGNHDAMMLEAVRGQSPWARRCWLRNGGKATLASYGATTDSASWSAIPNNHLDWLAALPMFLEEEHRIYVHAGIESGLPMHAQDSDTLLWIRGAFLSAPPDVFDRHVVHGHTPLWEGKPDPAVPERLRHRTNLDTGAAFTGVLTVGVFDDKGDGLPRKVIEITR